MYTQDDAMEFADSVGENPLTIFQKMDEVIPRLDKLKKRVTGQPFEKLSHSDIYECISLAVEIMDIHRLMNDAYNYWKAINILMVREMENGLAS